jgi:hypothetical protein
METLDSAHGWFSFFVVAGVGAVCVQVLSRHVARDLVGLVWLGFALRLFGTVAYVQVVADAYSLRADAFGYYTYGLYYADALAEWDLPRLDTGIGTGGVGTKFVRLTSGVFLLVLGPNVRALFLAFSLLALLGVLLSLVALGADPRRQCSELRRMYGGVALLMPSVWYWSSTAGKDSLLLFAIGLTLFALRSPRRRLPLLACGLGLSVAVRAHIGLVLAMALLACQFQIRATSLLSVARLAFVGLAMAGVSYLALDRLGLAQFELDALGDFVQERSANTERGGSQVVPIGGGGVASLLIDGPLLMFRPLPWEISGVLSGACALELLVLWACVARKRSEIREVLSGFWRKSMAARFALVAGILLCLGLGGTIFNLGILVRQRISVFVLLFFAIAAAGTEDFAESEADPAPPVFRPRWQGNV